MPRSLRPASFLDTSRYAQLAAERDSVMYGSCPSPRSPLWRETLGAIDRQISDERWRFENPGLSGRFRIALGGKPMDDYGVPRFETREDAVAYLAGVPGGDHPNLSVVEVPTRAGLEEQLRPILAPEAQVTLGGQTAAHRADIAADRRAA